MATKKPTTPRKSPAKAGKGKVAPKKPAAKRAKPAKASAPTPVYPLVVVPEPPPPPPPGPTEVFNAWVLEVGGEQRAFDLLCDFIINGGSLRAFVLERGLSYLPADRWIQADADRRAAYDRARETRADYQFEEMHAIAEESCEMPITDKEGNVIGHAVDAAKVRHQALRIDTRKWSIARMKPKVYGDKIQHTGADGGAIQQEIKGQIGLSISPAEAYARMLEGVAK